MRFHSFFLFLSISSATLCQTDVEIAGELYDSYLLAREKGNLFESYQILYQILNSDYNLPEYNIAVIRNNLGVASKNLGLYEQAKENYLLALGHCKINSRQEKTLYLDILINQGILHRHIGEYLMAIEYYEEAEKLLIEEVDSTPGTQERFSLVKLNKALVLYDQENYTEALKLLFESKDIKEAYDLTHLGSVYFNIGRTYHALDSYSQANIYYKTSIERWELEYDSSYYQLANVFRDYGQFLIEGTDPDKGLEYYNRAIDNYILNYGNKHAYISDCYNHIAKYYLDNEEYDEALFYLQNSLISICPDFNNTNIFSNPVDLKPALNIGLLETYCSKLIALKGLASSNRSQKKTIEILEVALETANEAFQVIKKIQNSYLTRESRLFLIGDYRDFFAYGIDAALQLYKYTGIPYFKEKAYAFVSHSKSLELNFDIKEKNWMYMRNMEGDSVKKLLSMYEQIYSLTNLIYTEEVNLGPNSVQVDKMKHELFTLRRSFENSHKEIFGKNFDSITETMSNHNPLIDLQSSLSKKQTIIEFALGEKVTDGEQKIYTFIITKNSCEISQGTVDGDFTNSIQNVYKSLSSINPASSRNNIDEQLIYSLHDLYIALIYPIEEWVRTRNLTIIPDGELILIPFDLLVRDIDSLRPYSDQKFLLYDCAIGYAPNSTFINKPDRSIFGRSPSILTIAPDFRSSNIRGLSNINSSLEIEEILKGFNGDEISDINSKNSIAKASTGRILHFATHSVADPEITGNPYLILGTDQNSTYIKLFDFEICNLEIESPMIVLNSCESGIGPFYQGEGMLSISRSFLLAGASSVIHTLWPIENVSSSRIIIDYYHLLSKGLSKPEALRKAKIRYLESTPNSFTHPHFWGSFQVVGDPNSISNHRRTIQIAFGIIAIFLFIAIIRHVRVKYRPEEKPK